MLNARRYIALALTASLLAPMAGCASQTVIQSMPPGAKLSIDGAPVGETPYTFAEPQVWLWTKHSLVLEKRGYATTPAYLDATVSIPHLIAGIFLCFPLIAVGRYEPTYVYTLFKNSRAEREVLMVWLPVAQQLTADGVNVSFE
mgnify:CR=1 FL=1